MNDNIRMENVDQNMQINRFMSIAHWILNRIDYSAINRIRIRNEMAPNIFNSMQLLIHIDYTTIL